MYGTLCARTGPTARGGRKKRCSSIYARCRGRIFSIPAGRIFERSAHPRTSLALGQLFWRVSYLLIAALPWISPSLRIPAMILISGLAIFPAALYNVAIIAVIGDLEVRERHSWI